MDAKTQQKMNEGRAFFLAAETLSPLIEERRQRSVEELMSAFRSGHKDLLTHVARVEAYTSILEDIQSKGIEYQTVIDKYNKEN